MKRRNMRLIIGLIYISLAVTACGKKDTLTETQKESSMFQMGTAEESSTDIEAQEYETVQTEAVSEENSSVAGDSSEITEANIDSDEYRYREVLNEYYRAFSEEWDRGKIAEDPWVSFGCSEVQEKPWLEHIGYCFMDMNHDGSNELLIGEIRSNDSDNTCVSGNVISMLKIENNEPTFVVDSWPRSRNYLWENGLIYNEGSGSGCSNFTVYSIDNSDLHREFQEGIVFLGGENPWYRVPQECYDYMEGCIPLSSDEAESIVAQYEQKIVWPEYRPFSEYEVIL